MKKLIILLMTTVMIMTCIMPAYAAKANNPDHTGENISGSGPVREVGSHDNYGDTATLFSNHKATICMIWATWCPFCKANIPALQAAHEYYTGSNLSVQIIGLPFIDTTSTEPACVEILDSYGVTFPNLTPVEATSQLNHLIRSYSMIPVILIIDTNGTIRYQQTGAGFTDLNSVREFIEPWLDILPDPIGAPIQRPMGDVNNDGAIDSVDALIILRYAMDLIDLNDEDLLFADYNMDGTVDTVDALCVIRASLDLL